MNDDDDDDLDAIERDMQYLGVCEDEVGNLAYRDDSPTVAYSLSLKLRRSRTRVRELEATVAGLAKRACDALEKDLGARPTHGNAAAVSSALEIYAAGVGLAGAKLEQVRRADVEKLRARVKELEDRLAVLGMVEAASGAWMVNTEGTTG